MSGAQTTSIVSNRPQGLLITEVITATKTHGKARTTNCLTRSLALALVLCASCTTRADEPVPAGLTEAINNPAIPSILDVTILDYNAQGHGLITVSEIYKKAIRQGGKLGCPRKPSVAMGLVTQTGLRH